MKLIMEQWRKFTERVEIPPQSSGAVPPKDRPAINIYPEPGALYDPSTGRMDKAHASELLDVLDQEGQKMKSADDPYTDEWLEKTSEAFHAAIEAFQQKGREEADAIERSLNDQFKDAIGDIRAIIQSRSEGLVDTVDITDPRGDVDTLPGIRLPSGIDDTDTEDLRPVMQKTLNLKKENKP